MSKLLSPPQIVVLAITSSIALFILAEGLGDLTPHHTPKTPDAAAAIGGGGSSTGVAAAIGGAGSRNSVVQSSFSNDDDVHSFVVKLGVGDKGRTLIDGLAGQDGCTSDEVYTGPVVSLLAKLEDEGFWDRGGAHDKPDDPLGEACEWVDDLVLIEADDEARSAAFTLGDPSLTEYLACDNIDVGIDLSLPIKEAVMQSADGYERPHGAGYDARRSMHTTGGCISYLEYEGEGTPSTVVNSNDVPLSVAMDALELAFETGYQDEGLLGYEAIPGRWDANFESDATGSARRHNIVAKVIFAFIRYRTATVVSMADDPILIYGLTAAVKTRNYRSEDGWKSSAEDNGDPDDIDMDPDPEEAEDSGVTTEELWDQVEEWRETFAVTSLELDVLYVKSGTIVVEHLDAAHTSELLDTLASESQDNTECLIDP